MVNKNNKSFDVLKSFEIFNSERKSMLTKNKVKFVHLEAQNFFISKSHVSAQFVKENEVQFTVINNKKVYDKLSGSWNNYIKRANYEN